MQIFQTHNTAVSCLKWLAIFAVHGTKTKEGKLCLRFYKTCLPCAAEYLNEMQFLTFIHYIKDLDPDHKVSHVLRCVARSVVV